MLARNPILAVLVPLSLALAACGDARSVVEGGGGGGCTTCHGTAGLTVNMGGTDPNLAAAPPVAPSGDPAEVIGAHQAHVNPAATGSLSGPLACAECHVVPTSAAHASPPHPTVVVFGTSSLANGPRVPADGQNPGAPLWNSPDKIANTTCSNIYCHGSFRWYGNGQGGADVVGNLLNTPDWTGTAQAACGSCHVIPPAGHIAVPAVTTDPASCHACHPGTVDRYGAIVVDVGAGTSLHVNGRIDEGAHSDPSWYVDPVANPGFTPRGGSHTAWALDYTAPSTGATGCLQCHVSFESPTGDPSSSCNACHASTLAAAGALTTNWQQNCVFCHGDNSKLLTYTAADHGLDPWIIAPPVCTRGETLATDLAVGAHQKHANPTANTLSSAFLCSECHTPSLPPDLSQAGHLSADGSVPLLLAGSIATTGGVQGSFTTPSCSATYCHGNFTGGNNASPAWNGDASNSSCTSCHGVTGDPSGIAPMTGRHPTNWAAHSSFGNNCQYCHSTVATGSTSGMPTITAAGKALHVNGTPDVSFNLGGTWTPNVGSYGGTCNANCHGGASKTW